MDTGTGSGWGGAQAIDTYQYAYSVRANYAISGLNMPQLLNGGVVYELPFGNGKAFLNRTGFLNAIVGGWQASSTFQLHSGIPFTPTMGTADLSGSLAGNWLPNRVGQGTLANPTLNLWFDPTAFAQPAPYTFGNSGRNILRGPGFANMSLALAKNFRLHWLGDASDALNHPNFGMPDASIGTSGVGVISNAITQRNIQLGARISF
jgi:hypothetical protein